MKIEEWVGERMMIGVSGTAVTGEVVQIFRETHAGGLIVFRPNFSSAAAFRQFLSDLENALGRKLLVAVDHEGGRVIHLAEGVTAFPDNLALGATQNEDYAHKQGEIEGVELRRLGIDLNLAPTLDVLTRTYSPNIGIRSYGSNVEEVRRLGIARIKGMQSRGLSACAKHFPGLGQSPQDPHLHLPVLESTWQEMKKIHLKPFSAAIKAGVDTIMSSHPIYPRLDPENVPVTFSKKIIQDYLRKELGFKGVILSDDLEMGALTDVASIGEAACRAVEAGHDMVLVCHNVHAQREVYDCLLTAYHDRRLPLKALEKSVERIRALKEKHPKRFGEGHPQAEDDGARLARTIAKEAVAVSKKNAEKLAPLKEKGVRFCVIFPKISALGNRIFIEDRLQDEEKFIKDRFKASFEEPFAVQIVQMNPTDHDIEQSCDLARSADFTVLFCFDAHLYPQNHRLLDAIQQAAPACALIFLRDPYDEIFVRKDVPYVHAYGFRAVQIEEAIRSLFN